MSNPPAAAINLQQAKDQVRRGLLDGTATGVAGVGIDSINQDLLVFVSQESDAKKFLAKAGLMAISHLYSQEVGFFGQARNLLRRLSKTFTPAAAPASAAISLKPTSAIEPDGGDQGSLGCFLSLGDGTIAALTAEHLFHRRNQQIVSARICNTASSNCLLPIGTSKSFGGLQAGTANKTDCALFTPNSGVSLTNNGTTIGNVVKAAQMPNVNKAAVMNIASNSKGQVLDTDATIKILAFLGGQSEQEVLLDGQILVMNQPKSQFGSNGDSGALVVMAQNGTNNSFQTGDALGLYSVIVGAGTYHFVTPLHACMTALGATAIYQPPS